MPVSSFVSHVLVVHGLPADIFTGRSSVLDCFICASAMKIFNNDQDGDEYMFGNRRSLVFVSIIMECFPRFMRIWLRCPTRRLQSVLSPIPWGNKVVDLLS